MSFIILFPYIQKDDDDELCMWNELVIEYACSVRNVSFVWGNNWSILGCDTQKKNYKEFIHSSQFSTKNILKFFGPPFNKDWLKWYICTIRAYI